MSAQVVHSRTLNAYATANNFWNVIVDPITVLSNRMTGVRIETDHTEGSQLRNQNEVWITDGAGNNTVTTVGHELGHAAHAHAFDEFALVYDVFNCDIPHKYFQAEDCEKIAWTEGMADFISSVSAWTNNAPAALFGANILETVSDANDDCIGQDFLTEACQAAALWDIYDDPTGDDDPLDGSPDGTFSGIIAVLDAYPNGCLGTANRCSNEGGEHGTNHWDFLKNWNDVFSTLTDEVRDIYEQTGIDEGGAQPF